LAIPSFSQIPASRTSQIQLYFEFLDSFLEPVKKVRKRRFGTSFWRMRRHALDLYCLNTGSARLPCLHQKEVSICHSLTFFTGSLPFPQALRA